MKDFSTYKEALEYAGDQINKYEFEIVKIKGKLAMLSSTCLPTEDIIRNPIEQIVKDVLNTMEYEGDVEDISMFIGAEMTEMLIHKIEKEANVIIANAGLTF